MWEDFVLVQTSHEVLLPRHNDSYMLVLHVTYNWNTAMVPNILKIVLSHEIEQWRSQDIAIARA